MQKWSLLEQFLRMKGDVWRRFQFLYLLQKISLLLTSVARGKSRNKIDKVTLPFKKKNIRWLNYCFEYKLYIREKGTAALVNQHFGPN